MKLARSSLVRQVQEDLRGRILDGSFPSGSQLPAEVDLARTMGVSRTSLREAVQQLELDGLLMRRHGYGTFVRSSPMLHSALNVNQSASELIRAHGMTPGTRDPQVRRATATAHEAERLGLADDEPVVVLERVRTADGRPVVFTRDVIPRSLLTGAGVDTEELADDALSLYHFFAERLGISVADGTAWIRPDVASRALAERLGASPGTATLVIEQLDRDASERPVLLTWEHYLADTFEFIVHRRGPGLTTSKAGPPASTPAADARQAPQSRIAGRNAPPYAEPPDSTKARRSATSPDGTRSADRATSPDDTSGRSKQIGDATTPRTRAQSRRKM